MKASTRVALGETASDRERIKALQSLRGVGVPTASVLLHLVYPERYPILDVRALHALGVPAPSYGHRFWESYVTEYRRLLEQAGVDDAPSTRLSGSGRESRARPSTHRRMDTVAIHPVSLGGPLTPVAKVSVR